jgi:hypothetical protein
VDSVAPAQSNPLFGEGGAVVRWLITGFALVVAASLGCSGKPPDQPNPGGAEPPRRAKDRVRWVELTEEDRKVALPREYPAGLRRGMSDEQLARDLDLQAWAFEFSGGPLRCWVEFEESGQQTMPAREPAQGGWDCDAGEGRVIFSVGRGASERMKRIMQQLGKDADPESVSFNLRFRSPSEGQSGSFGKSHGNSPLWFGWPDRNWTFTTAARTIGDVREGEAFMMLRVESVEPASDRKDAPRKVMLMLKGSLGAAKKE